MTDLDPILHQPQRLRIVAWLYRARQASFTALRDALCLSDGNLSSHAQKLVDAGYVEARRVLADARFELRYRITPEGSAAFRAYAAAVRQILAAESEAGRAHETREANAGAEAPPGEAAASRGGTT